MGRLLPKLDDRTLSASMLFVFTPALVMYAILTTQREGGMEMARIAFFWFFHTAILLVATHQLLKILRYSMHQRRLILLSVMILNAANYPIPLNEFQYGDAARETAVRIMLISQVIFVTIGVYLASDKGSWVDGIEEVFRLPLVYAAIIGFTLFMLGLQLPGYHNVGGVEALTAGVTATEEAANGPGVLLAVLGKVLTFLQAPALPLNLLMLGLIVGKGFYVLDYESYQRMVPAVVLSAFLRLVFSPVLGLVLILLLDIEGQLAKSLLIHTAMPTAIYVSIFVAYYGQASDKRFAALCIVFSTLVSLLTVPLLVMWIENTQIANFQMPVLDASTIVP